MSLHVFFVVGVGAALVHMVVYLAVALACRLLACAGAAGVVVAAAGVCDSGADKLHHRMLFLEMLM